MQTSRANPKQLQLQKQGCPPCRLPERTPSSSSCRSKQLQLQNQKCHAEARLPTMQTSKAAACKVLLPLAAPARIEAKSVQSKTITPVRT